MSTLFNLVAGRTVKVREGFGLIPAPADTEETIAFAAKTYAITASGVVLTKADHHGVIQRQEVKPADAFQISAKARRLQDAFLLAFEPPYRPREQRSSPGR